MFHTKKIWDVWTYAHAKHLRNDECSDEHLVPNLATVGNKKESSLQLAPLNIEICSEPFTCFCCLCCIICPEKLEIRLSPNFYLDIIPGTDCHGTSLFSRHLPHIRCVWSNNTRYKITKIYSNIKDVHLNNVVMFYFTPWLEIYICFVFLEYATEFHTKLRSSVKSINNKILMYFLTSIYIISWGTLFFSTSNKLLHFLSFSNQCLFFYAFKSTDLLDDIPYLCISPRLVCIFYLFQLFCNIFALHGVLT